MALRLFVLRSTIRLGWQLVALLSSWGASRRVQTITVGRRYCPVAAGSRFARRLWVCMLRHFSYHWPALGWCLESFLGGLGPSPTLLADPLLKHHAWRSRIGGCRSQGCHGYPTRSALVLEAPLSFQAPSPSSSIVDEFNENYHLVPLALDLYTKCLEL